jgi:tetratricopeptide (TPR) repeat protein
MLAGQEIRALVALDRLEEIEPLLDSLEAMEPAWDASPGSVYTWVAGALHRRGYADRARAVAQRGDAWYRAQDPAGHALERARALLLADRPADALALVDPLAVRDGDVLAHGLRGVALALTGDVAGAEAEARWCETVERPYLRGEHTYWRAAILAALGRREEAVRLRRQAYREGRSYTVGLADADFRPLWGHEPYERLLAPRG